MNAPARIDCQHDFGFRVVPGRLGMQADQRAVSDRGHWLRLGENLGIGADPHFEVLRPGTLLNEHLLDARSFVRAGPNRREVVAEDSLQARTYGLGAPRVAARLFLDDSLQRARHECDPGGLDGL
ncbi:MAG: hypothetical protein E6H55_16990 [Betaproteobacteria bacterium]|nr:MAG: hypothetical protein E6H55_16990 [Betaproteobacteria bacterium]